MKAMLADKAPSLADIRYPVSVSPKLDGIRALVLNGVVMSRNMKPIPNKHVQYLFGHLEGLDGELIVGDPAAKDAFRKSSSGVMTEEGEPEVAFHVFDVHNDARGWTERTERLQYLVCRGVRIVPQMLVRGVTELLEAETAALEQGYEGLMLRDPNGPYKQGRSTTKEGFLLKLKRFEDSEAEVIVMEELMKNMNEAFINEVGRTARSSHKENLVPRGTMGSLHVRDLKTGVEFNVGSGFDDDERTRWWAMGAAAIGRIIKYQYFPSGGKDKPRFPTYLGERHPNDL